MPPAPAPAAPQVLPLVPPETTYWSPYSGLDGLCGNTLLLPLEGLAALGLLAPGDLPPPRPVAPNADFAAVHAERAPLLDLAAAALLGGAEHAGLRAEMAAFRADNAWVEQSALFSVLTELPELEGLLWWDWPAALRDRDAAAVEAVRAAHAARIETFVALQFLFDRFWGAVKVRCDGRWWRGGVEGWGWRVRQGNFASSSGGGCSKGDGKSARPPAAAPPAPLPPLFQGVALISST